MRALLTLSLVALLLTGGKSHAACTPLIFGYLDQNSPPYYLGSGSQIPEPPGASVDLVREVAASAGCELKLKRLPITRLQSFLESGTITAAAFGILGHDMSKLAVPLDKNGQIDSERSLQQFIVVFVRKDTPIDTDPATFLKGHVLGITHGAPYGKTIGAEGYTIDDGAMDPKSSFEKLLLHRIDAYATALVNPGDMDEVVAARYGGALIRLNHPLLVTGIWLAINKAYYENNRAQVEEMWTWAGNNANRRFAELLKKYAER
jgi:polar amino acid transport system substrate-binding protein